MEIEVEIVKDIPVAQIEKFEDRVVYNTAVNTREFTKKSGSYPYLSGKLQTEEIAAPVTGSKMEYGLTAGVGYAVYVYNFKDVHWTNSNTKPQWYMTNFKENGRIITDNAVSTAIKEV